ncbi:unnamed protein product [Dicrocoelium dendriticum]|nr:unnamed protein product [Dicrocoelium dendriticum]
MSELAFYFSNANKLEYDEDVSEDQSSVSKSVQKCPRPVSMYLPSHCDSDLSPPRCHVDKHFGFCVYHNRIDKQNSFRSSQIQLRDGGSCVCLCTSEHLPPEVEVGNVEYKRKLVNPTPNRFEHLVTQMKWRLNEGGGEAIYRLGVDDDGHVGGLAPGELAGSLDTLERMAKRLNATVHLLQERTVDQGTVPQNAYQPNASVAKEKPQRKALELLVRQSPLTNFGSVMVI